MYWRARSLALLLGVLRWSARAGVTTRLPCFDMRGVAIFRGCIDVIGACVSQPVTRGAWGLPGVNYDGRAYELCCIANVGLRFTYVADVAAYYYHCIVLSCMGVCVERHACGTRYFARTRNGGLLKPQPLTH